MKNKKYANRGMGLEKKIDISNRAYKNGHGLMRNYYASVHKIPTNVKIMNIVGPKVSGVKQHGELVDYVGVMLGGTAVAFDAKETKGKSLPLSNIKEHQYKQLEMWHMLGSKCFLIVYFSDYDKYYRLDFEALKIAFKRSESGKRGTKSINIDEFDNEIFYVDGILNYLEGI